MAQIVFYPGDDTETTLEVAYICEFPRNKNGTCAFCNGDPCAEMSDESTNIGAYFKRNKCYATTCPCCHGRAT